MRKRALRRIHDQLTAPDALRTTRRMYDVAGKHAVLRVNVIAQEQSARDRTIASSVLGCLSAIRTETDLTALGASVAVTLSIATAAVGTARCGVTRTHLHHQSDRMAASG